MAVDEDEDGPGIPEWVVTFGDMMSLLLTFFIMLVSLSEIKEEEQFQAMVESIKRQLGHNTSTVSMSPGPVRPRNAPIQLASNQGRARRLDTMRGGQQVQSPTGEHPRVEIVEAGNRTVIGTTLVFPENGYAIPADQIDHLRDQAHHFQGKPQRIVIRGHTTRRPVPDGEEVHDHWELAFARAREVQNYLVQEMRIDPERIRLSVSGPNEPSYDGVDVVKQLRNSRVQVFMIDEVVDSSPGQ